MIIKLICLLIINFLIILLLSHHQVVGNSKIDPPKASTTMLIADQNEVIKRLPRESIRLKCPTKKSNKTSKPKVRWFKDGKLLVKKDNPFSLINIRGHVLSLNYVDFGDYGTYHCTSAETNKTLKVFKIINNDKMSELAFRNINMIRVYPESKIAKIGQSVTFHCDYRTDLILSHDIKWIKNCSKERAMNDWLGDGPIEIDGIHFRILDVPIEKNNPEEVYYSYTVSLQITNVSMRDSGIYACLLNEYGRKFPAFGTLRVVTPIEDDYVPQMITEDMLFEISSDYEQVSDITDTFLIFLMSTSLFAMTFIALWYLFVRRSCMVKLSDALFQRDQSPRKFNQLRSTYLSAEDWEPNYSNCT